MLTSVYAIFDNRFSEKQQLFLLFIVSLLSSLILTISIAYPRGSGTDGAFYALSGANLFLGNGFTYSDVPNTFTWPLFSILIGLVNLLLDDLQISGHVILILSFSLGVFPLYFSTKNLFGRSTAQIAASLYFLNGFLLRFSGRFLPESLMIFLLLCSWYFVSRIIYRIRTSSALNYADFVGAGFFFGLSYLTKPEAIQYFLIGWVFLVVLLIKKNRKNILHAATMLVIFFVTIFPQFKFIHDVTGKWEITTYNRFLFREYVEPLVSLSPGVSSNDPRMEYNYNAYIVRGPYTHDELKRDISKLPNHLLQYIRSLFTIIGPFHIFLFLCSFFLVDPKTTYSRYLSGLVLLPVLTLIFWYNPVDRHFIVFVPFFIILSASVLEIINNRFKNSGSYILAGCFIVLFLQSYFPIANQAPTNSVIGNHRKLGEWMKVHVPDIKGKLIADRKPYVTFLVQGRYYRYNKVPSIDSLMHLLKKNKVDYLVVDDFYTRTKNPGIADLLDGMDHPPHLQFIHDVEDSVWGRAILYKIN